MSTEAALTTVKTPKVFISYSWTTPEHEAWVVSLAERLVQDGVDVVLDKWDLKEGQDKYAFMEKMVTDKDISKVLVVCDQLYADKADGRQGGVGTESQIISKSVYDKVDQEKFVPLITECNEDGKAYVPTFFGGRIHIDFSSEEKLNENYEQLLRSIYNRPLHKKPTLGKPPLHIFDDTKIVTTTFSRLQMFKDAVTKDKNHLTQGLLRDYFSSYNDALEQFRITDITGELLDEVVMKSITDCLPYQNEFVDLSLFLAQYTSDEKLYEEVMRFFEGLMPYTGWPTGVNQWNEIFADNYKFIIYELFLYFVAALIKNERFEQVRLLTDHHYYEPANRFRSEGRLGTFAEFNYYIETLDKVRNTRLNSNRLSMTTEVIKERAHHKQLNFETLMQADMVLFLNSILSTSSTQSRVWYPSTLVYAQYRGKFDLFARATSTKYFNKIKTLFGVSSKQDLVTRYQEAANRGVLKRQPGLSDVSYEMLINLEQLDTM